MQTVDSDRISERRVPSGDGDRGMALLALFTAAVLIVVGALWMVAVIGGWWIIALAFTVHLVVTAGVLLAIFGVLRDPSARKAMVAR
jgi:type IV secretory pathway TrbD component